MYNDRIISELQKAHGRFHALQRLTEREEHGKAEPGDAALAGKNLAEGLMALTEAMIQSELRAQEYMRQMQQARADYEKQQQKKG